MKKKTVARLLLASQILIMIAAVVLSADFITWLVNNTGSTGWYNLLDAIIVLAAAFVLIVAMMLLGMVILKYNDAAKAEEIKPEDKKETAEDTAE